MALNPAAKIANALWEHEDVVRMRQQFAELDPKLQSSILLGSMVGGFLLMILLLVFVVSSGLSAKQETEELQNSIQYLNQSSEKMDELRQKIRAQSASSDDLDVTAATPLPALVEKVAGKSAIGKDAVEVPSEGTAGNSLDVKLNKISLKQLMRFLFYVENSKAQTQFQNLLVEKRGDPEGYLWATLKLTRLAAPAATSPATPNTGSGALAAPTAPAAGAHK